MPFLIIVSIALWDCTGGICTTECQLLGNGTVYWPIFPQIFFPSYSTIYFQLADLASFLLSVYFPSNPYVIASVSSCSSPSLPSSLASTSMIFLLLHFFLWSYSFSPVSWRFSCPSVSGGAFHDFGVVLPTTPLSFILWKLTTKMRILLNTAAPHQGPGPPGFYLYSLIILPSFVPSFFPIQDFGWSYKMI